MKKKILALLLVFMTIFTFFGCGLNTEGENTEKDIGVVDEQESYDDQQDTVREDQPYYDVDQVALYINTYDHLPPNYVTKSEAAKLGWKSSEGNLWDVTDRGVIGGDRFGNREGLLPDEDGRKWYECDVNYSGGYRGAERIVYSNDGLIYYSKDHYETFTQMY